MAYGTQRFNAAFTEDETQLHLSCLSGTFRYFHLVRKSHVYLQLQDVGGKKEGLEDRGRRSAMNKRCVWNWSTIVVNTSPAAGASSSQRTSRSLRPRLRYGSRTAAPRTSGLRRHTSTSSTGTLLCHPASLIHGYAPY